MRIISDNQELKALCRSLAQGPFLTIDTEFLRDKTYYPQLCLVQVAAPEGPPAAIDPLAVGIDLSPLLELMADDRVLKVFHAARQDLEIFYNLTGKVPHPIFDSQVAAMVCGFGESAGYHALVNGICGASLDKGAQFTDWSRRPLSDRQLSYALDDVTYLRDVYRHLDGRLEETGRRTWVEEEMLVLTTGDTYKNDPDQSWQRIKIKTDKPKTLATLKELAAWREREAQRRDVPRNRIIRDETLADIAVHPPRTADELAKIRGISPDMARGKWGAALLEAVKKGMDTPADQCPRLEKRTRFPQDLTPALEMLKMLLRIQASEHDVAAKLIADGDDLEALAMNPQGADVPALKGWRHDVFGREAQGLLSGKLSLCLKNGHITKLAL